MITKTVLVTFLLIAALTGYPLNICQTKLPGTTKPMKQTTLKLVAEYKKNFLEDVSSDGKLILFYQTSVPMRTYALPNDGGPGKANQPKVYDDMLRVVERESGRELKHIKVEFSPDEAKFIPDTRQVFYKETRNSASGLEWRFRIWGFDAETVLSCSNDDTKGAGGIVFLDSERALYHIYVQSNEEDLLASLTIPNCHRTIIGPVNPNKIKEPYEKLLASGGLLLSQSKDKVLYETRAPGFVVRDLANLNIIKQIKQPKGLILADKRSFTPDGKFLIVVATNTYTDTPETRRYLLFYDTKNFEMVRQLDITNWRPPILKDGSLVNPTSIGTAIAISPDSRMMAVGYTKEERKASYIVEQAQVIFYDLTTGEEVVRATHPEIKQNRNDPFVAKVNKLAFTPDGKYLLSSTYDTLVWEIETKIGEK